MSMVTTELTSQRTVPLQKFIFPQLIIKFPAIYEPKCSLPSSQEPVMDLYHKP